jgi:uncharacterized Zn finger protein (UPF0148 family)
MSKYICPHCGIELGTEMTCPNCGYSPITIRYSYKNPSTSEAVQNPMQEIINVLHRILDTLDDIKRGLR